MSSTRWFRFWFVDDKRRRCLWFEARNSNPDDALAFIRDDHRVQKVHPDFPDYKLRQLETDVVPGGPRLPD